MKPLKIGVLGAGYYSHARSCMDHLSRMPDVELVGLSHRERTRVEPLLAQFSLPYYADHRQLLAMELDAVLVCSENVYHAEMTLDAVRAGKHVLCEKPLGITAGEMRRMVEEAKGHGVQLGTMLTGCYHPAVLQAKQTIVSGSIGEVAAIKGTNRGKYPGGWYTNPELSGGGAIIDHTVHAAGVLNMLTGSRPREVYAVGGTKFRDAGPDDAGIVHVTFENGVIAVIDPSWSRCDSFPFEVDFTAQIIGTGGVLSLDCYNQKNEYYLDVKQHTEWDYFGDDPQERMVEDFIQSLRSGTELPVTGEDGLFASIVALAAYQSMRRGEPVTIAELLSE